MKLTSREDADSQEYTILPVATPPLIAKAQQTFLPLDIILYLGNFLNFTDYRSFIQSIWPNGDESDIVQAKLWALSTHTLEGTFLNGKRLKIDYNFDSSRTEESRVLIRLDSLLPIFGKAVPLGISKWATISELCSFVERKVHMDECSNYSRAYCECQLMKDGEDFYGVFVKPAVDECENGHFHHSCWEHVVAWLISYLKTTILLQECKELFNEEIAEQYAFFPEEIPYFQTGKRATQEYLLKSAQEIDVAIYESDDEYKFTTVEK